MSKKIIETEDQQEYEKVFESFTDNSADSERPIAIHHVERQSTYFWVRLYLNNELDINVEDTIVVNYLPNGETLDTKFICYAKKGLDKDAGEFISHYNPEDDKRVLCLMVSSNDLDSVIAPPMIRSMFKNTIWYRYNLIRRDDLEFTYKGNKLSYYDSEF